MDNLLKHQKNIVLGAIITIIVLLALNMVLDASFREGCSTVGFSNPIISTLLTALFAFVIAGALWGFSSSEKGGHGNEATVSTTNHAMLSAVIATVLILFFSLVGGSEGLFGTQIFVWVIGLVALFFLYLPTLGSLMQKIGAAHDRSLYEKQNTQTNPSDKATTNAKAGSYTWLIPIVIVLLILFVLSRTLGGKNTDNHSVYNASATAGIPTAPTTVTPVTPTNTQQPEQEVGGGAQPR